MPTRHFILGTAGHVDHGKTQLVNCLTGWDTDRLKEEKERGISIELGFAPLRLDDETTIGIVDVPGHERFVKHMVAGAGGIDLAILVVAADEGVMPQTREHLEVLRSLGVKHGVVVLTKIDLASDDDREILNEDIAQLVENTFLANAPVIETSARTNVGIEDLKRTLGQMTNAIAERNSAGSFRLAIDRVFHKQGIGVVITGSCYSGTVTVGDSLQLLPSEKTVRVRGLQTFGEKRDKGYAGERLAIALQGGRLGEVRRGDMLVTPSKFDVSYMIDARIELARYAPFELKQRERVRVHHGAMEAFARLILLEADTLESGGQTIAQLRLESPIVAARGDRFVLRKYSPSRVIGGGRIIDPRAGKHQPGHADVLESLTILESGSVADRIAREIETAGLRGVRLKGLEQKDTMELIDSGRASVIAKMLFDRTVLTDLGRRIYDLALEFNRTHPMRYGIDKEEVRQKVAFPHPTAVFNQVLEHLAADSELFSRGNLIRAGSDEIELSPQQSKEVGAVEEMVRKAGMLFVRTNDITTGWKGEGQAEDYLLYLRDAGRVERIGEDGYLHAEALSSCLRRLREWFGKHATISVPEFKELFGITRKQAIPLLEYLDANRFTARRENHRVPGARLGGADRE